jgi:hypothetical protein
LVQDEQGKWMRYVVRLKSVSKNLLLNGEGDGGGASSALLYYQKNKTTKLSWQFI